MNKEIQTCWRWTDLNFKKKFEFHVKMISNSKMIYFQIKITPYESEIAEADVRS